MTEEFILCMSINFRNGLRGSNQGPEEPPGLTAPFGSRKTPRIWLRGPRSRGNFKVVSARTSPPPPLTKMCVVCSARSPLCKRKHRAFPATFWNINVRFAYCPKAYPFPKNITRRYTSFDLYFTSLCQDSGRRGMTSASATYSAATPPIFQCEAPVRVLC